MGSARKRLEARADARRKFGGYKREEPKAVRQVQTVDSQLMQKFRRAWDRYEYSSVAQAVPSIEYRKAFRAIGLRRFSSGEVLLFSQLVPEFLTRYQKPAKAGFFLSAMVNGSKDADFELDLGGLREIDCLLQENTKNVNITANNIEALGSGMKEGNVVIGAIHIGTIGLIGGNLTANASVRDISASMGGKIVVEGNVGAIFGCTGGEIHVNGEIGTIENIENTQIYQKGKRIM